MAIKFWTPRHRTTLYSIFDNVRLYGFATIEYAFITDMLDQKITDKAMRRIEAEWVNYWEDIFEEEPSEDNKLLVHRFSENPSQFILLKAMAAIEIASWANEKYNDLFIEHIGEVGES